jgi:hypothetical protein
MMQVVVFSRMFRQMLLPKLILRGKPSYKFSFGPRSFTRSFGILVCGLHCRLHIFCRNW